MKVMENLNEKDSKSEPVTETEKYQAWAKFAKSTIEQLRDFISATARQPVHYYVGIANDSLGRYETLQKGAKNKEIV